jgi:hypothetical protein
VTDRARPDPTSAVGAFAPFATRVGTAATIYLVSGTVHHWQLILHVTGPVKGRVRVSFTGRLRGKIIAFAAKTIMLNMDT